MPVIAFQAFVVATLMIARLVSPGALKVTAICWSAFTLIMVFMPWLMGLQLVVIWGAYLLIAPRKL